MTTTAQTRLATTSATLHLTQDYRWRDDASCREVDPELFFPTGTTLAAIIQTDQAKAVCAGCPSRQKCLEWALETGQETGVWGGLGEDERRALKQTPVRPIEIPEPSSSKKGSHRYPGYATAADGILGTRLEEVRALVERHASVHDIAAALGTNMPTVRKVLERLDKPFDDTVEKVDHAAVNQFVQGFPVEVTDEEFLTAVQICVGRDMTLAEVDLLHGWAPKTAENWVNRLRKRYKRAGREFPSLMQPSVRTFSEAEVVAIRKKSRDGASDFELAMSYSVKRETIRSICRGQSYPQFGGPLRPARQDLNQNEMGEAA